MLSVEISSVATASTSRHVLFGHGWHRIFETNNLMLTCLHVVPIDIVPERFPVQHTPYLDNPHTLEIILGSATIRVTNETDPQLLSRTLQILKGSLC